MTLRNRLNYFIFLLPNNTNTKEAEPVFPYYGSLLHRSSQGRGVESELGVARHGTGGRGAIGKDKDGRLVSPQPPNYQPTRQASAKEASAEEKCIFAEKVVQRK